MAYLYANTIATQVKNTTVDDSGMGDYGLGR